MGMITTKALPEVFKKKFIELGGRIVASEAFTDEANTVDFKAQLTNIKASKPDFLYCPNYYAADAMIMKQAHEIGLNGGHRRRRRLGLAQAR